jgi:hypothetical protein
MFFVYWLLSRLYNLYTSFMMICSDVAECCKTFIESRLKDFWLVFNSVYHVFLVGFTSFKVYRDTRDPSWADRGKKNLQQMKIGVDHGSPFNFCHELQLMQAEEHHCNGASAKQLYKCAISNLNFVAQRGGGLSKWIEIRLKISELRTAPHKYRVV